ncbi:SH3 and multiple ankyrin repeat domains protein 2 [Elysia marginata]|uniref:SH3 and multiple ankyrin repeat domains protein 2 n=1 Tax=Elysia marginata TaxID=1093978 RepID=A0AAV4EZV5_9GAST|nr:SH3 and multiple ankyrin repeat domains protein 2 [Elysia marginata]
MGTIIVGVKDRYLPLARLGAGRLVRRNTSLMLGHLDTRLCGDQLPRVVLLHRSSEGYGFVLRGAKSKLPTGGGFNDFAPTAEYPALQYLDSVDPGSQADRAGLKSGDFILEINNENVVRASHEHVVHLIRSSSDVLTLKVITVSSSSDGPPSTPTSPLFQPNSPPDWRIAAQSQSQHYLQGQGYNVHPDSGGAMTLPSRKKQGEAQDRQTAAVCTW